MTAHRFDPVSALLAVAAIVAGLGVALGFTDPLGDADAGVWLAIIAIAVGFMIIPWGRSQRLAAQKSDEASEFVDLDS